MPTPVSDPDLLAQLNAPDRSAVSATPRVWGDKEAEAAGLYETPARSTSPKPVTDPNVLRLLNGDAQAKPGVPQITVTPMARFGEMAQPGNADQLGPALNQRAAAMTRGPEVGGMTRMATDFGNVLSAASQGTDPNVSRYSGRLISADVLQDDAGNIQYRDPQTGEVKYTDNSTQVAMRDPADNRVKVFSRSEDTNENPAVGVSRVLAPGLGAGAPTARPAIAAAPKTGLVKASDIFSTAKPYYRAFEQEASQLQAPGDMAATLGGRIRGALEQANFIEELAPPVFKATAILEKGEPITLETLQKVKRVIGRSFNSPDKNVRDAASVASAEIGRIMAEFSPSAARNLKTADEIHSTAIALQDLQRKQSIADLRKGRAGYGGNAVNSMRQVLSPIVQKAIEGRKTPFKPDEITAMREIVEGTPATNTLRQVGAVSPSKGGVQILGAGYAGVNYGSGAGLAIPAIGMASNKLAAVMTGKQIERLKDLVAKRSPAYAEAVAKATGRFEKAQMEFANKPSANTLAAFLSASRSLSAGLTKDGIGITSGDLLRSISGPMKGTAEPNQEPVPRVENQ